MELTWIVEGMSCQHCVRAIENSVKPFGGEAHVDLAAHAVGLTLPDDTDQAAVRSAIEAEGYAVKGLASPQG